MTSSNAESLCETLREGCLPVWESLHEHPFVTEMAAGTLPVEKFRFYIEQNIMYLQEYARAIALGVARSRDLPELRSFSKALDNIVMNEIPINKGLLDKAIEQGAEDRGGSAEMAPGTLAYTSFLTAKAFNGGPLEIMTTIMPCAWSYGEIAQKVAPGAAEHPVYSDWLGFFASDEYQDIVTRMKGELEELKNIGGAGEESLTETFRFGARLELGFWDMAYGMVQWPDRQAAVAGPAGS